MSFQFFRPWEDGGQGNTRQTADDRQRAAPEPSKKAPHVLSVQTQQRDVPSQEATRSAQVLSDIPGPLCQKEEAHRTEKEDGWSASHLDAPSLENLLESQDTGLRQTSASSVLSEEACNAGKDPDYVSGKAANSVQDNCNHIWKSSCQTDEHGTSFSQSSNMHRRSKIHANSKLLQCTLCEKKFFCSDHLQTHKQTHTGSQPYQCPVCDKAFSDSNSFRWHQHFHTGSKSFKCAFCKKAFIRSHHLHEHERIHTGSKPFKCSVCEKAFTQSSSLHAHKRTHTGSKSFKCSVCDKAFAENSNLCKHECIHTGSKPFKCSVCKKAFTQSNNLHTHKRIHTGSKPFKCSVCEKAFTHSWTLCRHDRLHRIQTISM